MDIEEDFTLSEGYGFCPDCGYPLNNWGAISHGDGDISDEIGYDRYLELIPNDDT